MIKIYYRHTIAERGGFGILGKGILHALDSSEDFDIVGYNDTIFSDEKPDIIFTYGMPDLIDFVQHKGMYKGNKFHEETEHWGKVRHVHYAVWESSELPKDFVRIYKQVDLLLTATRYTAQCFKRQGLNPEVWHHAVDKRFLDFYKRPKESNEPFVFLHHNAYEFRKGWEIVLQAFTKEFGVDENVKLIMKGRERKQSVWLLPKLRLTESQAEEWRKDPEAYVSRLKIDHPLIEEIIGHVSDEEMVRINSEADCFVFPAKGEGWGLPPFEAAAMGIVPILPNKGAFTEWFNKDCMLPINIAGWFNSSPRYPGVMFMPSELNLRRRMRWAFENRDTIGLMGQQCKDYINANFTWDKVIRELYNILNK